MNRQASWSIADFVEPPRTRAGNRRTSRGALGRHARHRTPVAEIPSPSEDLSERAQWLRGVMADRWSNLDPGLRDWRQAMIDCVGNYTEDCVVFCHFIAINVIVGAATGADEVITFRPDNGSVTRILADSGTLRVIELGREADTRVN